MGHGRYLFVSIGPPLMLYKEMLCKENPLCALLPTTENVPINSATVYCAKVLDENADLYDRWKGFFLYASVIIIKHES